MGYLYKTEEEQEWMSNVVSMTMQYKHLRATDYQSWKEGQEHHWMTADAYRQLFADGGPMASSSLAELARTLDPKYRLVCLVETGDESPMYVVYAWSDAGLAESGEMTADWLVSIYADDDEEVEQDYEYDWYQHHGESRARWGVDDGRFIDSLVFGGTRRAR